MPRISKRLVDAIAPEGDRTRIVWDDALPGFGLRVTPAGVRAYVIEYRHKGRSRRMTLGRHGPMTPDAARKLAAQRLGEVAAGRDPLAEKQAAREEEARPAPAQATVEDVAAAWLDHQRARVVRGKLRERTLTEYARQLAAEIEPRLGALVFAELKAADAQALHDALADRPVLANRCVDLLSAVWRWAEEQELASGANPCRRVDRFAEKRRERALSHDDLSRLGVALRELSSRRPGSGAPAVSESVALLVRLLAFTGCRPGEIKRLAWTDVDVSRRVLHVREGKTGDRSVWLNAAALAAVEALRAIPAPVRRGKPLPDSPWCFPSPRDRGRPVGEFRKPWAALLKAARIEHAEPYILRHTFASESESLGHSPYLTAALLGHSAGRRDMTRGYIHHLPEDVRRASERVAASLAAALDGTKPARVVRLRGASR